MQASRAKSAPLLGIFRRQLNTNLFRVSFPEQSNDYYYFDLTFNALCYSILYCFLNFYCGPAAISCDSAMLNIFFCNNNNLRFHIHFNSLVCKSCGQLDVGLWLADFP